MHAPGLHILVKRRDLAQVRTFLADPAARQAGDINAYDSAGYTPLMCAVSDPAASIDVARTLLEHGADIHLETRSKFGAGNSVLALALRAGDPAVVRLLLQHGADIHYQRENGYRAAIDAATGSNVLRDARLPDLLDVLIAAGVDLNATSSYGESGCRILSRIGRFDAVGRLLAAGADAEPLRWTPLARAVVFGSLADVREEIGRAGSLEDRDCWERTPWLLAIQTGDIPKASLLREHGADAGARGRCGKPPLFYAIENFHGPMLRWLLAGGAAIEGIDEFGATPLMDAAEHGNAEAVAELLRAGARVDATREHDQSALSDADTREVALLLLDAGADPRRLSHEARRTVLGFAPEPDEGLLTVSLEDFREGKARRFGAANPEKASVPFWEAMIRAGVTGYQATIRFEGEMQWGRGPVWCAQRFGQSITFLPDGRTVQVAGEHEDHYDPDFCIYNDVFIHGPDGRIGVYLYPEGVFPPTDFHTATLLGGYIYLIGSLGYPEGRRYGKTPVYCLDICSLRMEEIATVGPEPGWIYEHTATALPGGAIRVTGGKVVTWDGQEEQHTVNTRTFVLQTEPAAIWTVDEAVAATGDRPAGSLTV